MTVTFDSKDGYFEELRHAPAGTIVRAEIVREEINAGGDKLSVVSGFSDETCFYEAIIPCGEEWKGGRGEAESAAHAVIDEIRDVCERSGLKLRRGKWQPA